MSDKPFIEKPDEHAPDQDQVFCFFDSSRPCSAECMAFLPARPEGPDYEGQTWSACMILVNVHKTGKHAVALAAQGQNLLKHLKVVQADEKRGPLPQPPPVR